MVRNGGKHIQDGMDVDDFYNEVEKAQLRISKYLHDTSVLTSETLDNEVGIELYFKAENMQKSGSFKARGAVNAVLASKNVTNTNIKRFCLLLFKIFRLGKKSRYSRICDWQFRESWISFSLDLQTIRTSFAVYSGDGKEFA